MKSRHRVDSTVVAYELLAETSTNYLCRWHRDHRGNRGRLVCRGQTLSASAVQTRRLCFNCTERRPSLGCGRVPLVAECVAHRHGDGNRMVRLFGRPLPFEVSTATANTITRVAVSFERRIAVCFFQRRKGL